MSSSPTCRQRNLPADLAGRGARAGLPNGSSLIGIGDVPWADVALARDYTDRELRLACQSAAHIARLRNQHHELARAHQEVAQLAETDPLTSLPNRRAWDLRLPEMLARASRRGETLWLAIVDLDAFKTINDRDGMQHGDRVLADTGKALSTALRRSDLVARLGGDEFGVLLASIPAERVEGVLDRLRGAIDSGGKVTASIGYVAVRPNAASGELLATAEKAMRAAKRAGGNRIVRGTMS